MPPDFTDKVALITGGGRGIGAAVARAVAEAGAHVLLLARTESELESVYDDITKNGGAATGVPMDLTDFPAIDRLGAALSERWGRLDLLVANAGALGTLTPLPHVPPEVWSDAWAVNVAANARLIRALDPLLMAAETPRAVFTTSGAAQKARPFWGVYSVSKAALDALARTWAHEHENDKLRINLVSPGPIRTAMRAAAMPGEDPETLPPPEAVVPVFLELLSPDETRNGEIVGLG